jgi:hypothetical protein
MAITLKSAKTILQQDLFNAFKDAYMTQYEDNKVSEASKYNPNMKQALNEKAIKFADSLSTDMAEAIYNFVKEIGIQVTIPPSVIAPSGPCSGTIPMTSFTII